MKTESPDVPFIQVPVEWVMKLKGGDVKRLLLLQWRFDFFASLAFSEGRDLGVCFYESQERLATLFEMSTNSRTKVGEFLKRMEGMGFISTKREKYKEGGKTKTRLYIVVNNPAILSKYNLNR